MSDAAILFTTADLVAGVLVLALNAYVLMGGADFGGGVWDLLARGPRRDAQRALVAHAIGPIWEANHVWLIVAVVVLFTGFPDAFAALSTVLHIPLALMLVGIVLRGSAFTFRSYGARSRGAIRGWGRAFAIASAVTPVLLGICLGAVASGGAGEAAARLGGVLPGASGPPSSATSFQDVYVAPWLAPFPLAVGVLALALFAFLAAVYLTVAAEDEALREDFRRRALAAAAAVFVAAAAALLLARVDAPRVRIGLTTSPWALPFQVATGVAATVAIAALWRRRYRLARAAAIAQVSLILWGWALSQYPYIIPPTTTIAAAAAPRVTLRLLLWALAAGAAVLLPSLWYLFRTFARGRAVVGEG